MINLTRDNLTPILDKIKEYDRIMIFRHIRNDGDCVGASKGLKEILKLSFPEKEIYIIDEERSEYLAFLGPEDEPVSDEMYRSALGIVVDSASKERISNQKYVLCKELIKIDHHIPVDPYGDISWVEEKRSSCSEMIVELYNAFKDELKINRDAATFLYTGIVTDSGRFRFSSVDGDTMRCAGALLDIGVDTDILFAQLYLEDFGQLKFKAHVCEKMQMTENGVAYVYVDREMQEKFGLTQEQASTADSCLESIKGAICWLVFIDNNDEKGSIRVRLRSRFVHINSIAEKYHGGGHACASGATVYSFDEMNRLLMDADAHVKEYKETHENWL